MLKLPRVQHGYKLEPAGSLVLVLCLAACSLPCRCVTFVFEGRPEPAPSRTVLQRPPRERCREIRLSGPLFMLYTPLKRAQAGMALNFHDVRANTGIRDADTFSFGRCTSCDATTRSSPICPRNSRRLYVEARKPRDLAPTI